VALGFRLAMRRARDLGLDLVRATPAGA